jgi:hypothetical protein
MSETSSAFFHGVLVFGLDKGKKMLRSDRSVLKACRQKGLSVDNHPAVDRPITPLKVAFLQEDAILLRG